MPEKVAVPWNGQPEYEANECQGSDRWGFRLLGRRARPVAAQASTRSAHGCDVAPIGRANRGAGFSKVQPISGCETVEVHGAECGTVSETGRGGFPGVAPWGGG